MIIKTTEQGGYDEYDYYTQDHLWEVEEALVPLFIELCNRGIIDEEYDADLQEYDKDEVGEPRLFSSFLKEIGEKKKRLEEMLPNKDRWQTTVNDLGEFSGASIGRMMGGGDGLTEQEWERMTATHGLRRMREYANLLDEVKDLNLPL